MKSSPNSLQSCATKSSADENSLEANASPTVTGLTKGTSYTFQVAAVNVAGTGLYAKASGSGATPRAVPGTPTNLAGVVGNAQVALTWTAPANNGDEISDYEVKWCLGSSCTAFAHTASAETSITVNNLTNGSAYTFQVAAKNAAGTGTAAVSGRGPSQQLMAVLQLPTTSCSHAQVERVQHLTMEREQVPLPR